MTARKPKRRPIQAKDLADLQQIMDQAAARDAAEKPTPTKEK
jgi:hypothetical protein